MPGLGLRLIMIFCAVEDRVEPSYLYGTRPRSWSADAGSAVRTPGSIASRGVALCADDLRADRLSGIEGASAASPRAPYASPPPTSEQADL